MNRIEIINQLIQKNKYINYLEIGVRGGDCFNAINCHYKTGVDPDKGSAATQFLTSDEFFKKIKKNETYDIIFIDGLHHADQVEKDILNSLKHLSKGGTIVMHDCLPTSKRMQEIPLEEQSEWTGDVWKAYVRIRQRMTNLTMCVVDCDYGCGIIQANTDHADLLPFDLDLTYENFLRNKHAWMNIITTGQFVKNYL